MSSEVLKKIVDKLDQLERNQKAEIKNLQSEMLQGFANMDMRLNTEIKNLQSEMSDGFAKVNMRFDKVQTLIEGIAFGIAERIGNEAEFAYRLHVLEQQVKELQQKLNQRQ